MLNKRKAINKVKDKHFVTVYYGWISLDIAQKKSNQLTTCSVDLVSQWADCGNYTAEQQQNKLKSSSPSSKV